MAEVVRYYTNNQNRGSKKMRGNSISQASFEVVEHCAVEQDDKGESQYTLYELILKTNTEHDLVELSLYLGEGLSFSNQKLNIREAIIKSAVRDLDNLVLTIRYYYRRFTSEWITSARRYSLVEKQNIEFLVLILESLDGYVLSIPHRKGFKRFYDAVLIHKELIVDDKEYTVRDWHVRQDGKCLGYDLLEMNLYALVIELEPVYTGDDFVVHF